MPKFEGYGVGSNYVASGTSNKRQTFSLEADGINTSLDLLTEGMPHLYLWAEQTVGALGATVQLEFMVRTSPAPGVGDEWLPLVTPFVLVLGAPTLVDVRFPATKIRARITRAAGQLTAIDLVLGCSSAT